MYRKTKSTFFSRHTLSLILAFGLVALVAGVYFLFKPFPAGSSLEVKANVPEAALLRGWSAYANAPVVAQKSVSTVGWSAYANAPINQRLDLGAALDVPAGKMAASVAGSYANHSTGLREAAAVVGWSAYANPPTIVDIAALRQPMHKK
jgi:hypothetical protein